MGGEDEDGEVDAQDEADTMAMEVGEAAPIAAAEEVAEGTDESLPADDDDVVEAGADDSEPEPAVAAPVDAPKKRRAPAKKTTAARKPSTRKKAAE
jgi:hypothetical protein